MSSDIRILDEERLDGYVFRVGEFERGGCTRGLACRLELCDRGGYELTFYGPHAFGLQDAQNKRKPMTAIPLDLAEHAIAAIRHAVSLNERYYTKEQA